MESTIQKINSWLFNYLHHPGDSEETIMNKKIWWLLNVIGLPFLILMSAVIGTHEGSFVVFLNSVWISSIVLSLLAFHFQKDHIEAYALFSQIVILVLSIVKAYLMGGLLHAGGVVFIGLIAPIYAITLPNKKRAFFIFLFYMIAMITVTLLQSDNPKSYILYYYFLGFIIGVSMAFLGLYYYTTQFEKLKKEEKKRMRELDEFKTKFYTNITHEFRTPLTIIQGMADQIKDNPEEWMDEGLKMIKRNGKNLLNLINQMLDLSKLDASMMPVNLIQDDIAIYIKYLVESFHSLADAKDIRILFKAEPEEIIMDFDPDKIMDIISNLLSNAIKFTPVGGLIHVSVLKDDNNLENQLIITVKDSGSGIPKEHLPKVFNRYFQSENSKEQLTAGSGLGLTFTKELVKLLKGKVEIKSALNKGSTFTVSLPITNNEQKGHERILKEFGLSEQSNIPDKESNNTPKKHKNEKLVLLIVEDNKDVKQYLKSILSSDYHIEFSENGKEGFEKASNLIPDLVISDVMMPVMDGLAFCEKLKSDLRTSHIPVVILTARADIESKMKGLNAGADAYLAKPFNKKELIIRIEKLIELRKSLQERYKTLAIFPDAAQHTANHKLSIEDSFMKQVRKNLETHLCEEEFGIAELCRSMAMSRSQLYRKFSALTDTSIHQFIRKLRLTKAKELLLSTELNVSEVAYDTGFKNLSHFSRVYSEEFGISPSKARE